MSTVLAPDPTRPPLLAHARRATGLVPDLDSTYEVSMDNDRALRRWLYATMVAVLVALVVGGATRLTESGLSITVWKPVTGVLPPLTDADWQGAYSKYLAIPEAQTVHAGITLEGFKRLFWWEWVHRLLARIVGLVIAVPYFWLLWRGRIRPSLRLRLSNLPILVTLQGVLGWYMVQSGLSVRTSVSQYRLTAHLSLAVVIYVLAAWTALRLRPGTADGERQRTPHRGALLLSVVVVLVIVSGGFVAGLDAGMIFNTFPLMGGRVVPDGYGQLMPWWRNWFENPVAAQFNHRVLAVGTAAFALWLAASRRRALRRAAPHHAERRAWGWVIVAVAAQLSLGVATLLLHVPISIAALHQLGALALLTAALAAAATDTGPIAEPSEVLTQEAA